MEALPERERVAVVGGGPAGLAAAATLRSRGISALVLDRSDEVGASWKAHYDRLHLHTVRWLSALPGLRIPRQEGKWVPRDGVVRYLKDYARHHDLRIALSTEVTGLRRDDGLWQLATNRGIFRADAVVIATGYNREPVLPPWPGLDGFEGELIHSSDYRNGFAYTNKDVLVVGAGNSGAEIAVDLVESRARNVWLSVRTAPNIQRRDVAGFPTQMIGIVMRKLPVPVVDTLSKNMQRLAIGDLSKYGMPAPERGVYSRVLEDERIPILDVGLIRLLKEGRVTVVPAVERFERRSVILAGGRQLEPDAVIASTGFRRALDDLVGRLGVLNAKGRPIVHGDKTHPAAPDLYFIGFTNPLGGNLRELGIDAKRIARAVAGAAARS
ncbi:MAG TPA: NAD(P)/FAD-dependent oxidoreductase [Actinomycetota bacterium]|nr:NAD(P)/FAD-dependent oxidoreductase [Actinomycetota bacterium]